MVVTTKEYFAAVIAHEMQHIYGIAPKQECLTSKTYGFTSNAALQTAKQLRITPFAIATAIVSSLNNEHDHGWFVTGPGFINYKQKEAVA